MSAEKNINNNINQGINGPRPSLYLPPRSTAESMFLGATGFSPGPMTLVSNFFSETDPNSEYRSFSQLLSEGVDPAADSSGNGFEFKQQNQSQRPAGLAVSRQHMFTIPAGLSPGTLLDSPTMFNYHQPQVIFKP